MKSRLVRLLMIHKTSFGIALVVAWAPEAVGQISVPPLRYGTRPVLQPNKVGSFAAQPFEYGRSAQFSTRKGCNDCGIPPGNYDREIPVAGASAISFYPPLIEVAQRGASSISEATSSVRSETNTSQDMFVVPSNIHSKQFRIRQRRIESGAFVLENPAVTVQQNGLAMASGKLYQTGGPTGTDRGGRVRVEVRGYGSALVFSSRNFSSDQLPDDAVLLWSHEVEIWVPRGGPTNVQLLNTSIDEVDRPGVQATFSRLTHVEVMISPRKIR